MDDSDIVRYKTTTDDDNKTEINQEIKTTDGIIPKRLGIAIVGGGGACGDHTDEK